MFSMRNQAEFSSKKIAITKCLSRIEANEFKINQCPCNCFKDYIPPNFKKHRKIWKILRDGQFRDDSVCLWFGVFCWCYNAFKAARGIQTLIFMISCPREEHLHHTCSKKNGYSDSTWLSKSTHLQSILNNLFFFPPKIFDCLTVDWGLFSTLVATRQLSYLCWKILKLFKSVLWTCIFLG